MGSSVHQLNIDRFMRAAQQDLPNTPTVPSLDIRVLRARLILEEALETIQKGLQIKVLTGTFRQELDIKDMSYWPAKHWPGGGLPEVLSKPNLVEIADGCADLSVVTIGTLSACGISDEDILNEVDYNNLAKFGPDGYKDEHGKWIKPKDHQPPRIRELLIKQGWKESV